MNMIDGLNVVFATRSSTGNSGQNTHEGGIAVMMTGVPVLGRIGQQDHAAGGASIDQLLLDNSPVLGGPALMDKTLFGSLQLAADVRSDRDEVSPRTLSYRPPLAGQTDVSKARQPMAPDTQPINVYRRIFGGAAMPTGTDAAKILAQKKSVLDYMRADLARMQTLVPASAKDRLAAHATAITQLESSLQQMYGSTSGGNAGVCSKPAMPPNFSEVSGQAERQRRFDGPLRGRLLHPEHAEQPPAPGPRAHAAPPHQDGVCLRLRSGGDVHVVGGHELGGFPRDLPGVHDWRQPAIDPASPPEPQRRRSHQQLAQSDQRVLFRATAAALQEFVNQPDVDGGKLIDNTIIVYLTEVARAYDHNQQNMPLIVFGGKNTGLKGGTFTKVTGGPLPQQTGGSGNRPFNDLWLTLLPKFGVDPKLLTNAIDSGKSYLGISGAPMYTGALPGLFS